MVWWIVAALVLVPALVLAWAAARVAGRRAQLAQTQVLVARQRAALAVLAPRQHQLSQQLARLRRQAVTGRRAMVRLRGRLPRRR